MPKKKAETPDTAKGQPFDENASELPGSDNNPNDDSLSEDTEATATTAIITEETGTTSEYNSVISANTELIVRNFEHIHEDNAGFDESPNETGTIETAYTVNASKTFPEDGANVDSETEHLKPSVAESIEFLDAPNSVNSDYADEAPLIIDDAADELYSDEESETEETGKPDPLPVGTAPRPEKIKTTQAVYGIDDDDEFEDTEPAVPARRRPARKTPAEKELPILTIDAHDEVELESDREEIVWHEIHNAYITRRMLTGELGGVEELENGNTIVVVYYKEQRIAIPLSEMMIIISDTTDLKPSAIESRQVRILGNMVGAEIDFIVRGIDSKERSVVASRRDAMMKKRRLFYEAREDEEQPRVHAGRIVQARVIAVAGQAIRIEVFGVECSIRTGDLSWDWVGDARNLHNIGDRILVRMLDIRSDEVRGIAIKVDIKSLLSNTGQGNIKKCRIQGKYAGKVTGVRKGVIFIRLSIGVNAVAHACQDRRMPGTHDDVSFVVTYIDRERNTAVGMVTRIIKQNI